MVNPENLLPKHSTHSGCRLPTTDLPGAQKSRKLGTADMEVVSREGSASPPSVFDRGGGHVRDDRPEPITAPTTAAGSDDPEFYDLKPPQPSNSVDNLESLAARLFSADHLDLILRDHTMCPRLTCFIEQYQPHLVPALRRYITAKKAIAAIDYANALAVQMQVARRGPMPSIAATLDSEFEESWRAILETLVDEALPAYITYRLVGLVTDSLVKEITGDGAPIMRDLMPSLAEVYCMSDPSLPDNPIVYASDGFFNTTQYGRDHAIGRNCRFLQGPETSRVCVARLQRALTDGQEICETLLNYRRDRSPFMNLLMVAPLYDNKGQVRYFLGCQIDISSLIEGGRGLESFSQLLSHDRSESRFGCRPQRDTGNLLSDFGQLLDDDEATILSSRARSYSDTESAMSSSRQAARTARIRYGLGADQPAPHGHWPNSTLGRSGRLPGVYQNYMLVRPFPSLTITFVSPALRIPGLLQAKFLDRVGGPDPVREGVRDALVHGVPVTAKIDWLAKVASAGATPDTPELRAAAAAADTAYARPRWIHCTPLLGSDDHVGVWMVLMVEREEVTGRLNRGGPSLSDASRRGLAGRSLFADYLKREGRMPTPTARSVSRASPLWSAERDRDRDRKASHDQFRNF